MEGKVIGRKNNGLNIQFESNATVRETTPDGTFTLVSLTQHEALQLINKMQEAIRWINNTQNTIELEWGKYIES